MQPSSLPLKEFSPEEARLARWLGIVWTLWVLFLIIRFPPYWALMDDHSQLLARSQGIEIGFREWFQTRGWENFGGRGTQPVYRVYACLFYGLLGGSSFVAYLVLFVINVGIFWMWGAAFAKCLTRAGFYLQPGDRAAWRWLYVILGFHFISNNNLFYFVSLQERLVILFAGVVLLALLRFTEEVERDTVRWESPARAVLALLLAIGSKESAVAFSLPISLWFFALAGAYPRHRRFCLGWAVVTLTVLVVCAGYFHSIRGGYTGDYDWKFIAPRLKDPTSRFYPVVAVALGTIFLAAWGWRRNSPRNLMTLYSLIFWPVGMLSYLFVMLPWHRFVEYYLIIPLGMFWIGAKLIVLRETVGWLRRWKPWPYLLIFLGLLPLAAITPARKFYQKAVHHYGTGLVVQFLKGRLGNLTEPPEIRMAPGCLEASDALSNFLGRPKLIQMAAPGDPFYLMTPGEKGKLLITNRECAAVPESFVPRTEIFRYHEWVVYG